MARRNNRLAAIALSQGMVNPMELAKAVEPWLLQSGVDDWLQFFLDKELLTPEQAERLRNAYAAADPDEGSLAQMQASVSLARRGGEGADDAKDDGVPRTLSARTSSHEAHRHTTDPGARADFDGEAEQFLIAKKCTRGTSSAGPSRSRASDSVCAR